MNLVYYKAEKGNFGDDINEFIWNELIPNFKEKKEKIDLIGIGSILDSRINTLNEKLILGSGIRDFLFDTNNILINDLSFVRGPYSSKVMNIPYITDSAYLLTITDRYEEYLNNEKIYEISYVPYFEHCDNFNWSLFEKITKFHVIKPTDNLDKVLLEISQSKRIIASAMHGAIMADIFRIPWVRLKFAKQGFETSITSELKWLDWQLSMNITPNIEIYSELNLNIKNNSFHSLIKSFLLKKRCEFLRFNLSNQKEFSDRIFQLEKKITDINNFINS